MPLYEYECRQCGRTYERIQKFSDPPDANCEVCGGAVYRLLSAPAFHFKGSGWYATDYAPKSGSTAESGADNGSKPEKTDTTEKKDTAKTESKPAESSKK
jgi:putative FmdB family regulatory protein